MAAHRAGHTLDPAPLSSQAMARCITLDVDDELLVAEGDQLVDQAGVQMPATGNLAGEVVLGDEPADPLREVAPPLLELVASLKTARAVTPSGVRIPLPPPNGIDR